ncbi:hypothetical protein CJ030_MR5G004158 [Morella rubra]|uniref:Uncharacterized protein n=1 Tax=Morella rubra TaxID=262757 RepID=A0A6A1VGJ8_9ROSI|nr:hypothetical protein CJ030_MR5G004158 [Morella rubra]
MFACETSKHQNIWAVQIQAACVSSGESRQNQLQSGSSDKRFVIHPHLGFESCASFSSGLHRRVASQRKEERKWKEQKFAVGVTAER